MPASSEPSITVSAPAAIALTMSPEYVMPPSAITGTPSRRARRVVCQIAESCGMPAPLITRVVQIDPAPTPTLMASAPASARASTPSSVTTLPATTGSDGQPRLDPLDRLDHAGRVAVGGVDGDGVDGPGDERLDALLDVVADADGGRAAQPAGVVAGRVRELLALLDVLHRDQPGEAAVVVDERQLLDAVALEDRLGLVERRADRRRAQALASS